jgi:uncharacterized protein YukE
MAARILPGKKSTNKGQRLSFSENRLDRRALEGIRQKITAISGRVGGRIATAFSNALDDLDAAMGEMERQIQRLEALTKGR